MRQALTYAETGAVEGALVAQSLGMYSHVARRGLQAGIAMAFARALGDFGATMMVGGDIPGCTGTLAPAVYDAWQNGDNQTAMHLSLVLSIVGIIAGMTAGILHSDRA